MAKFVSRTELERRKSKRILENPVRVRLTLAFALWAPGIAGLAALNTAPAFADGGAGSFAIAVGGADSATDAGGDGGSGLLADPGGGGGAGVTGGAGGVGSPDTAPNPGGAGGNFPGANGASGNAATAFDQGGSGGGGGAHGYVGVGSPTTAAYGGWGGSGGDAWTTGPFGAAGGGGAGGWGAVITSAGAGPITVTNVVRGGDGGGGGSGRYGGSAGTGGHGLVFTASGANVSITANVSGGNGGAAGIGSEWSGAAGTGGSGIVGAGISITNTAGATIEGGLSGDGLTRANAISFLGGSNTLTLAGNGGLIGNIGIAAGSSVTLNQSSAVSLANVITGAGGIIQSGIGTLTLLGANVYTGTTQIESRLEAGAAHVMSDASAVVISPLGTLGLNGYDQSIGSLAAASAGATVALGSASLNTGSDNTSTTFAGTITGTGSLTKVGTGTMTLTNSNNYSGGTTISGGTLQLGDGGTGGAIVGDITNNAALVINRALSLSMTGVISGTGSVSVINSSRLALLRDNTYTGGTTIMSGFLQIGGGGTRGSVIGDIINHGEVAFFRADDIGYAGVISGSGRVSKFGANTLTLTGNHTYTGGTTINDGTLQIGDGGNSGAISGDVFNNTALVFNRANDVGFGGIVSGNGTLSKLGAGTLTLTGDSTFTGGTVISVGTLDLGGSGLTGAIAGDVAVGGTLRFNRSNAYTFAGVVSDLNLSTGRVVQAGSGTTTLTANSTYTGATVVDAGTLRVNGDISSSSGVAVNAGGTLSGAGTVGNTTINGGTLAPGNSIGTLTVRGNLVLTSAATYMIEVSPAAADRVNVTGTAVLGGAAVHANFAAGSYVEKQYVVLNARGGVSGKFAGPVNTNLPTNFKSRLSYDDKDVYFDLTLDFTPPPSKPSDPKAPAYLALNGNQNNVSIALVGFFDRTGGIPLLFGALDAQGLTQVSGETTTGSQQTGINAMTQFMGMMMDLSAAGRSDASPSASGFAATDAMAYAPETRSNGPRDAYAAITKAMPRAASFEQRWSVWSAGFGGSQTTDGNAAAGSNSATSRIYGAAAGADVWLSPTTLAGISMAGGATSFSVAQSGTGQSDLVQVGGFLRHTVGGAYLSAAFAYGWQDITTERLVTVAGADRLRARFNANSYAGRVELGSRSAVAELNGIGITPYAAGQVTILDLPAYAESVVSGSNAFALGYTAKTVMAPRTELGLRADKAFALDGALLTLRGRAAWAHDFNTDRAASATFQALPGASFVVNGAAGARDAALTTASAEVAWTNGFALAATFEGEFSETTRSYAGKGVVRYAW